MPDWHVRGVRAKIDTGARTSAIHVADIQHLPGGRMRFEVVLSERPRRRTRWIEADAVRESVVRPSTGQPQARPVVRTTLTIGPLTVETEVGLVCRRGMLCRMLVGRRALAGLALVDPSCTYRVTSASRSHARPDARPGPTHEAHP